jgi:outer membrane lipoprotein-sorting protein
MLLHRRDRKMLKVSSRFFAALLILVLAVSFAGAAEFQADMTIKSATGGEMTGKVFVKGNSLRQELMTPMGAQVSIVNGGNDMMYVLIPGQNMYMEFPNNQVSLSESETIEEKYTDIATLKKTEPEKIEGYKCDTYTVEYNDPQFGKSKVWIAKKLNYPLKIYSESPQDTATIIYSNIEETKLSDDLFELPEGYTKLDM